MLPAAPDAAFDRIARLTRKLLDVPTAQVSLVDRERQVFPGAAGVAEPAQTVRETALSHSFCQYVVINSAPLVVADARLDPLLASNPAIDDFGIIAYAGMPLTDRSGAVVGSLCCIDTVPREWTSAELADLADMAQLCSAELRLRETSTRIVQAARRAEDLIATMPVGYLSYDADWRVTAANAEAARIVNSTVDQLVGHSLWELFPATIGSEFDARSRRVLASGATEVFEYFYPDPLNKWYEIRVQSDPPGLAVYFVDVTARYDGEARANEILTTMPVGFIALDGAQRISAVNALGARLAGGSSTDELLGRDLNEVFPLLAGSAFNEAYLRVADTGRSEVVETFTSSPRNAWFDVRITLDKGRVSLYVIDVTARHDVQLLIEKQAARDRTVATALQRAMLSELPEMPGLTLAARYLTATGEEQVGGDWYDAVVQPDGTLTVTIGDVSGHGIGAAATMGQLRAMLRGFLWDDPGSLAHSLSRLDRATGSLDGSVVATAIAARIEGGPTGERTLRWSNAGHLSPILVGADGTIQVLDAEVELMLGVAPEFPRHDHTHPLPAGSTLVLYTNGLVESPADTLAHGVERLADAVRWFRVYELDELLDSVLAELRAERRDDDIAVIAIRVG